MKVLEPTITCLVMSHMKPTIQQALESVVEQTRISDVEIVVIDSGRWFDQGDMYLKTSIGNTMEFFLGYPNITWYTTGESKDFAKQACPVAYWTNKAFELGLVRGKYVCMHYDDDIYYKSFFEKMAGYLDEHPEAGAVRCSQNRTKIYKDGHTESTPPLLANDFIVGPHMDCVVDGQQVMIRTSVIEKMKEKYGSELLPSDPDVSSCSHSDGIFFNRMSEFIDKLHFIPEVLCEHRNTVYSTYTPTT